MNKGRIFWKEQRIKGIGKKREEDNCNEREKKPKPTGIGAFAGGAVGCTIGLTGGLIGVIIGGVIGAIVGNAIECENERKEKRKRGC